VCGVGVVIEPGVILFTYKTPFSTPCFVIHSFIRNIQRSARMYFVY
jgi:hypothetical protein